MDIKLKFHYSMEVISMSDAILIPLQVFGLGFVISMCIAGLVKFLLEAIKHFTRNTAKTQE